MTTRNNSGSITMSILHDFYRTFEASKCSCTSQFFALTNKSLRILHIPVNIHHKYNPKLHWFTELLPFQRSCWPKLPHQQAVYSSHYAQSQSVRYSIYKQIVITKMNRWLLYKFNISITGTGSPSDSYRWFGSRCKQRQLKWAGGIVGKHPSLIGRFCKQTPTVWLTSPFLYETTGYVDIFRRPDVFDDENRTKDRPLISSSSIHFSWKSSLNFSSWPVRSTPSGLRFESLKLIFILIYWFKIRGLTFEWRIRFERMNVLPVQALHRIAH